MILTGESISAVEAEKAGLVASVHAVTETLPYAIKQAAIMASYSRPMVYMAKECVNAGLSANPPGLGAFIYYPLLSAWQQPKKCLWLMA